MDINVIRSDTLYKVYVNNKYRFVFYYVTIVSFFQVINEIVFKMLFVSLKMALIDGSVNCFVNLKSYYFSYL